MLRCTVAGALRGLLAWLLLAVSASAPIARTVATSLESVAHDSACFTQGLTIHRDVLFETCGLYGKSSLRRVDVKTGKVQMEQHIAKDIFAEGMTVVNNTIFMLTWKNRKMLLFDRESLELLDTKHYKTPTGEGWGLTTDGTHLIVSDGSDVITFFRLAAAKDGSTALTPVREMRVFDPINGRHIAHINELEYAHGKIYSNIWYKDIILQIDPSSGNITERYDLGGLYPKARRSPGADCLNGIAFDPKDDTFLLTGKLWPKYHRVHLLAPAREL